ncbi:hypothetical protein K504DRAFT_464343 [Pleomassaria siparia CBS 279.74]|uniref:RING-CH-type domain-containing protein n=1 Tax=Pleomassaria siparia CBS 279.74 TaxID=1314801 RepID=A0A6G1KHK1_9PLEO|nr:hypothetical protein K504DRAFT_464343 [Pleomassaria siparia CBS 279.74]
MASLPPQRPSQRRQSPSPADSASSAAQREQLDPTDSVSAASVNPQTLLLHSPPSRLSKSTVPQQRASSPQSQAAEPDVDPRKCWICFSDETEDDPTSSAWRSPCPCVLVAHERCLLDWIADLEAPNSRRHAGGPAGKILCPQCKSEIKMKRPQSAVVNAVRRLEALTGKLLLPGFLLVASAGLAATLTLAGQTAIVQIFGIHDALLILKPRKLNIRDHESMTSLLFEYMRWNWRVSLGVPLIPAVLVASRTTWADSILPFLPLIFFVNSGRPQDDLLQFTWPPSAAFTIAALPYVRGVYNAYYERVWQSREQQWLKEIQPRAGTDEGNAEIRVEDEEIQDILREEDDIGDGGDIEEVELEVDFDIFAEWNDGGPVDNNNAIENPPVPIARGPGPPLNAPPEDDGEGMAAPINIAEHQHIPAPAPAPAPNVPRQPAQPRRQRIRRERNINFSTTSLADTILGALVFPSVAAVAGEVLKAVLPKSWTTVPPLKPTGFLQTRWGRNILGGCLFVGIKDAVMLYVRWKMARNHRMRTVLDYTGKKTRTG